LCNTRRSISILSSEMHLEPNMSYISLEDYRTNSIWDVVNTTIKREEHFGGDTLKFYIRLRRKPLYYMFNIGAPVIILSALTVLTFCLPNNSGEKLGFAATMFLSFMVLTAQIANSLPSSSDTIPLLGKLLPPSLRYTLSNVMLVKRVCLT
jgi:nicotinic acetylcholine receptor